MANLSLGLHKGRPSYRRSLQPSKENIQYLKTWKSWPFLCVCHFCPPGSGSALWMRIRIQQLKLMRIRIQNPADLCKNSGHEHYMIGGPFKFLFSIVGSVIARSSIPVLHSCAAMLKISEMEYSGGNSIFLRYRTNPYMVYCANIVSFLSSVAFPGYLSRFRFFFKILVPGSA